MTDDGRNASRRKFLKLAATGIAASAVPARGASGAIGDAKGGEARDFGGASASRRDDAESPLRLVNAMQGTDSSVLFSRGNTLPIVALPFGMAHWTPQTVDGDPWFFRPRDQRLQGIRCTHQMSPWLRDYGYATLLPFRGDPNAQAAARASSYRGDELRISPDSLEVFLLRYRCRVALAPTERCAALRMVFEESGPAGLMLDLPGDDAEARFDRESGRVIGLTRANAGGVPENFAAHYLLRLDQPITAFEVKEIAGRRIAVLRFDARAAEPIHAQVATSFIGEEQASRNLDREIGDKSFGAVREEARAAWEKQLGRVELTGGTRSQRSIFYSGLYRASLFPRVWHEPDAAGNPIHYSPYNGLAAPGVMYADHVYWDAYRAWYPLMSILYPERLGEILQAWVNAAKEGGGWLPQSPCPGYKSMMTGTLVDAAFADAVAKGIPGFDVEAAYAALRLNATQAGEPQRGYGRRGFGYYSTLGYIPCDKVREATTETLDAAYGDFCIAQVARSLGRKDEARELEERSRNWRNVFDPGTGFMRGKLGNGAWEEPFEPFRWGGAFVEGSAWQHRFAVPHDAEGLMSALGGPDALAEQLEEMLRLPPRFEVGTYGKEIHEMSEMAAAGFGQYAHSDQPVHHVLYLFAVAGRRARLQYWVRRVLDRMYTPDDFPGDEDTGSMSAWYLLSALGIYPLCPGRPEYILGTPLFDAATLHLENGAKTVIRAQRADPSSFYVAGVSLNGKPHAEASISHQALAGGAEVVFQMRPPTAEEERDAGGRGATPQARLGG